MAAGEDPLLAAARELHEELGVVPPLRPLGAPFWFHDEYTWTLVFAFEARWDGPVVHQPSEVAEGAWWAPEQLADGLERLPFMPDGVAAYRRFLGPGTGTTST